MVSLLTGIVKSRSGFIGYQADTLVLSLDDLGDSYHGPVSSGAPKREKHVTTALISAAVSTGTLRNVPRLIGHGEVQQDLLLSCLTVGEVYCLFEVL
jgi:hypothetical protein